MPQKSSNKEGNRNLFKTPNGLSERLSYYLFLEKIKGIELIMEEYKLWVIIDMSPFGYYIRERIYYSI